MRNRKRWKRIKQFAKDDWVFKVDLMLDDFKELKERVQELEVRIQYHASIIYEE